MARDYHSLDMNSGFSSFLSSIINFSQTSLLGSTKKALSNPLHDI